MIRETKYNLIPDFVLEQYEGGNYCGRFQSIALFMDISGFTKMAQSFLRQEKEGVEELAAIINKIFDPIITIIERQGGFVATFAGDAITVLFPGSDESTALATCQTALQIRQIILQQGQYETPAGQYHLAVKQGLSAGEIEWGILGTESHKTYYFRGMGIERSTMAESRSKAGDIVIEESLFNLLSQTEFEYKKIEEGFHTLKYSNSLELINQPKPANNYPRTLTEQFFSTDLWGFIGLGEFRHVATLFLSFNADLPHDQLKGLVTATVELVDQYGGHFVEVDFGDKGGVIMLCFGAPKTHENALQRALEFSISLSLKLRDLNCEWGVGIANGQVYAGMIGTRLRAKYGVMGSSVNLAARLMSKAQQGQILVAESVSHQSGYRFNPIDPLNLKGFDSPVPAFVLAGILEDGPAEIKNYDDQLFVGRKAEQRQLLDFAQPVLDDRSAGIITIYGEPGIGKSVLANRFVAQFQEGVSWQ
ncbi:MAG: adenylate/guanylate cyclase domain-containing protein, partial [Chloroflexota bacterium]